METRDDMLRHMRWAVEYSYASTNAWTVMTAFDKEGPAYRYAEHLDAKSAEGGWPWVYRVVAIPAPTIDAPAAPGRPAVELLHRLPNGAWVGLLSVTTVIPHMTSEITGHPSVVVMTPSTHYQWSVETEADALKYADELAALVNAARWRLRRGWGDDHT